MRETFWSLLASIIAVFGTLCCQYPWDVWRMPVFRPYARTSRLRRWMFNYHPQSSQFRHSN